MVARDVQTEGLELRGEKLDELGVGLVAGELWAEAGHPGDMVPDFFLRWQEGGAVALCPDQADFGYAQWNFGMSAYGFLSAHEIAAVRVQRGRSNLVRLAEGRLETTAQGYVGATPYVRLRDWPIVSIALAVLVACTIVARRNLSR